jgi:hypothetical protein
MEPRTILKQELINLLSSFRHNGSVVFNSATIYLISKKLETTEFSNEVAIEIAEKCAVLSEKIFDAS